MKQMLKATFAGFLRTLAIAIITSIIVLAIIVLAFGGQTQRQQQTFEAIKQASELTVRLNRAISCELGVPTVDGMRDPVLLRACWTDEGLIPPAFFDMPSMKGG